MTEEPELEVPVEPEPEPEHHATIRSSLEQLFTGVRIEMHAVGDKVKVCATHLTEATPQLAATEVSITECVNIGDVEDSESFDALLIKKFPFEKYATKRLGTR